MLVAFSVSPTSPDGHYHEAVAAAIKNVKKSGLPSRTDPMFTTIEGSWEECMAVIKACCNEMEKYGPRVALTLKADIRPGYSGEIEGKLQRLAAALGEE